MNLSVFAEATFAAGRRFPQLPLSVFRRMPLSALHAMRAPALRTTLRRAHRAPYYREAFSQAGLDGRRLNCLEDLGGFFLSPRVLKTQPERLLCGTPELAIESSGTSGHVTRVYLSRRELEASARQGALLLGLYRLSRADRLLGTLDFGWGLGALLLERGVRYTPLFAMVPGRVDPVDAYERLRTYGFNVLISDPFWLARLTEIAREHGRPGRMKLLVGGGEGISERLRTELEAFWQAPLCMTYASTEAATILGFECAERAGYHINEFDFEVEIDNPDADGYGELVLTTANRRVMPLIRYRTGDIARWVPGACACGLPFRRFSAIRGRIDEQVSCAWGNVHPEFFEGLLHGVTERVGDWQVALYERDLTPVFQFRVEASGDARAAIMDDVLAAIRTRHPEAWLAYGQRLVGIEFCFFVPGTLRRARKLLRLVDERLSGPPAWIGDGARVVAQR
jgi:phenylacetate-CoA ligase